MTPETFINMVGAWKECYLPIVQAAMIGMVAASVVLGVFVFIALLLRNYLTTSVRM